MKFVKKISKLVISGEGDFILKREIFRSNNVFKYLIENLFLEKLRTHIKFNQELMEKIRKDFFMLLEGVLGWYLSMHIQNFSNTSQYM